jgi:hypothetical protein
MKKSIIAIILAVTTIFAASAATVKLYKPNADTPWFTDKVSMKDDKAFPIYDSYAQAFAFNSNDIKTTTYNDGSLKLEAFDAASGEKAILWFDAIEKDDIRSFADLCQAYTLLNIQQKLLK